MFTLLLAQRQRTANNTVMKCNIKAFMMWLGWTESNCVVHTSWQEGEVLSIISCFHYLPSGFKLSQYLLNSLLISSAVAKETAGPADFEKAHSAVLRGQQCGKWLWDDQFPKRLWEFVVDLQYPVLPSNLLNTWLFFLPPFLSLFLLTSLFHVARSPFLFPVFQLYLFSLVSQSFCLNKQIWCQDQHLCPVSGGLSIV